MTHYTDATRKKIVKQHIQDGRTLVSLVAEYGVSKASISNWVRAYRWYNQIRPHSYNRYLTPYEKRFGVK